MKLLFMKTSNQNVLKKRFVFYHVYQTMEHIEAKHICHTHQVRKRVQHYFRVVIGNIFWAVFIGKNLVSTPQQRAY